MKKTLAAVAILGAFAGTAMADVTIYGRVDTGFAYTHDVDADSDKFEMKSGQNTGSRWGLKGSEKISENLTVGFQLEGGFTSDDGKQAQNGGVFSRESRVYVQTQFGEIGVGRFGTLNSGAGSYDIYGNLTPFGTGWNTVGAAGTVFAGQDTRRDNAVAYKSPTFGGVTVYAMAAASTDGEGTHESDRYYGAGVTYKAGALNGALIAAYHDYGNDVNHNGKDDAMSVTAGVNYDFGVAKAYVAAQYFDGFKATEAVAASTKVVVDEESGYLKNEAVAAKNAYEGVKGYGVILGTTAPVAGGTVYGMVGYQDAEDVEGSNDYTVYQVGVGYKYPLSKKVYVYTAAGYSNSQKDTGVTETSSEKYQAIGGLVVNF